MQIAEPIARHCPFLVEGDVLSLSPAFTLHFQDKTLQDRLVGVRHRLHAAGPHIVEALVAGQHVAGLRKHAAKYRAAESQLAELLGFLNLTGALVRKRRLSAWPQAFLKQTAHMLLGVTYGSLAWRRQATPCNLLIAICRTSLLVIIATLLLGLLVISAGIASPRDGTSMLIFGLTLFIASVFVHESAHLSIIRATGREAAIMQRGMRLGIVHSPLPPKAEVASAVAGPAAGLATGIAGAACGLVYSPLFALLGVVIGFFHLAGFLPWYGDGISLRRTVRTQGVSL